MFLSFIPYALSQTPRDFNQTSKGSILSNSQNIVKKSITDNPNRDISCITTDTIDECKPVANAGSAQTVNSGDKVTLDGSKDLIQIKIN